MAFDKTEQKLYDIFCEKDLIDPSITPQFVQFCHNVYNRDYENRKPLLKLCGKVKNECYDTIRKGVGHDDDEALSKRVRECNDAFWQIIHMEAQHRQFDAYCLYLERYRVPKEKFYQPRRMVLRKHGLPQAFQKLIDDELDLLTVSLPPGTGKAQPLYSKVLTPNGFKTMGDIKVGDAIIAGNGNIASVIGIYPQGKKSIYEITLETGAKCRCSTDHLWYVRDVDTYKTDIVKTRKIEKSFELGDRYEIPIFTNGKQQWLIVDECRYIGEEECQCIMIDDPCHLYITDDYIITHNTTIEKFFHSAVIGWFPDDYSLFYSHSGDITRMYYDGVSDIVSNAEEYAWNEIFPDLKITGKNAKLEQFNVGKYKPFPSVQCTSVGSKNAGKVRAGKFLFVDDMIGSIEEALNKNTLEKLWNAYSVDARQRRMPGCKEIHIATRWSVLDVIGRLQQAYDGGGKAEFISVPAIDPQTGESNFMYEVNPFTVEFYKDVERTMDDISYRCLYQQDPIEREGLLYNEDELRRYTDLPDREPDAILGVCDTKTTGIDYMFLPVMYQYDNDYYLDDCICDDNVDFNVQYRRCTDIIVDNNVQQVEFESNAGGSRIAFEVQERVKEKGGTCTITTKATETNKETRIVVNAEWIKQNVLFKDKSKYAPKSDYGKMMSQLVSYSVAGKNKHDDVVDGLANFRLFVSRKFNIRPTRIIESPI